MGSWICMLRGIFSLLFTGNIPRGFFCERRSLNISLLSVIVAVRYKKPSPIIIFHNWKWLYLSYFCPVSYPTSGYLSVSSLTIAFAFSWLPSSFKVIAIASAILSISSGFIPREVTAAVPRRTPLVTNGD